LKVAVLPALPLCTM